MFLNLMSSPTSVHTATDIAKLFGITVARLAAANNVTEADLRNLQIGQRLTIPGS